MNPPGHPGHPGDPGHPGHPGHPGDPGHPGHPGHPDSHRGPDDPCGPGSLNSPGNPGHPDGSSDPRSLNSPSDPGDPGHPGSPSAPSTPSTPTTHAAGCVLWRRSPLHGRPEICLVHRPKYDDWSHPKGKLEPGEDPLAGALREVAEETGQRAVPGAELPTVRYAVDGRPKQVRYWAAEAVAGVFTPSREVDRVLWLTPDAARARLTRPRDRDLIDALLATTALAQGLS